MLYVFAPTGNAAHGYKFCGWSISDPRWTLIQIKNRCLGRKNLNPAVLGKASRSELGQKRRFDHLPATSGLPRGTDIVGPTRLVRFVPTRDSCTAANLIAIRLPSARRSLEAASSSVPTAGALAFRLASRSLTPHQARGPRGSVPRSTARQSACRCAALQARQRRAGQAH